MAELTGAIDFTGTAAGASPPATTEVISYGAAFTTSYSFDALTPATGRLRRTVVTDKEGAIYGEFADALQGPITFELNQPDTWSFVTLANNPASDLLLAHPLREVQIWRGDQLLTWGPAVRPSADKDYTSFEGRGAMWHLQRRHIGKANRRNYLLNGDFENGLAEWWFTFNPFFVAWGWPGAQPNPPGHEIVTTPRVTGTHSLRMENYVEGADAWATAAVPSWLPDPETAPEGDTWTVKGYVYVESFVAAAHEGGRGLYLERESATEEDPSPDVQAVLPGAKRVLEHVFMAIDEQTPVGVWQRFEREVTVPPGSEENIAVRIYAPKGVVYWDALSLTWSERLAFYNKDQCSVIAKGIVEHLQDPAFDKSDANISTNCPACGVLRTRVYPHAEHANGFDALGEFPRLDDGFDFWMTYTPTERVFTTRWPRREVLRPQFPFTLGVNIADFAWTFDGEAASSSVVVLGNGNGSDREEGAALDAARFDAMTYEQVYVAPPETPIDGLGAMAREKLAAAKNPQTLTIKTTPPVPGLLDPVGQLYPGDVIPVTIVRGDLNISGDYRIVRLTINPDDTLDMVLNAYVARP